MGRSDECRRYAAECLEMASALHDPKARATLLHGPPCCTWRRFGFVWQAKGTCQTRRKNAVRARRECLPRRSPWRASPRPAPFPARFCDAARSWPLAPGGRIPAQIADIPMTFPCRNNWPLNGRVPGAWRSCRREPAFSAQAFGDPQGTRWVQSKNPAEWPGAGS
jgi:hypothetical protein